MFESFNVGKYSFECFSHARPVLHRDISVFFDDLMPRYPPHLDFEKMLKGMEMVSKCPNIPPWRDGKCFDRPVLCCVVL